MDTFLQIALYSTLVLVGLTIVAGGFVFLGKWMTDNQEDPDAEH